MRIDFENIADYDKVILFPLPDNPLHATPVYATYMSGYFYCEGSDAALGPDYYMGDVLRFCEGYEKCPR